MPFSNSDLSDDFARLHESEAALGRIVTKLSMVGLFTASPGILGLAVFTTGQRKREIGIRKVLGSTVSGIVWVLVSESLKLVCIAMVVACPLAYICGEWWLESYAYRTDIDLWIFLIAGMSTLIIALTTVGLNAAAAALANPVESLRHE